MVCVFAALKKEVDFFLDALDGLRRLRERSLLCYEGSLAGRSVRVIRTGIGRASNDPGLYGDCSLVLSTGFCGALSPLLARGDFVVSTAVIAPRDTGGYRPGASAADTLAVRGKMEKKIPISPGTKESLVRAARETGAVLRFGATFTAGRVIRTAEEKRALHETCGALSVDMEDFQRLVHAENQGLPFLSLRVVLDALNDRVPSFRSAFRIPADMADLLKGAKHCARSLASLLARFVEKFEMA